MAAATSPESGLPKLRRVDQIKALTAEEAAKGYPVTVQGVMTWQQTNWGHLCIQDGTEGMYVKTVGGYPELGIGDWVRVQGLTTAGGASPMIVQATLDRLGSGRPPPDRTLTVPQALAPIEDCRWVALRGYVRSVHPATNQWDVHRLELSTAEGPFTAWIPMSALCKPLADAVVLLRGVCGVRLGEKRRVSGLILLVPSEDYIDVEETPPKDLFSLPRQPIQAVHELNVAAPRRIRVSGVVTLHRPRRRRNSPPRTAALPGLRFKVEMRGPMAKEAPDEFFASFCSIIAALGWMLANRLCRSPTQPANGAAHGAGIRPGSPAERWRWAAVLGAEAWPARWVPHQRLPPSRSLVPGRWPPIARKRRQQLWQATCSRTAQLLICT
ncbi:MAG: hypothetical protein AAB676_20910 [Verrucomicrobiota bacterium]